MLKEPKRIIAEEPLSPDSRDTGTGLFSGFADGKFSFSDGACVWCMWLSDSGSGFGKIVKRQTDLQKKCQKGLHNDIEKSRKSP